MRHTATVAAASAGLGIIKEVNTRNARLAVAEEQVDSSATAAKKRGAVQAVAAMKEVRSRASALTALRSQTRLLHA